MATQIKNSDPDPTFILRSGPQSVSCVNIAQLRCKRGGEDYQEVLISGAQDGCVKLWNLKTKRIMSKLQVTDDPSAGVLNADLIYLNNEDILVTHTRNGSVKFWTCSSDDGNAWTVKKEMEKGTVYEFGFCPIALFKHNTPSLAYPSSGDSEFAVTSIDPNLHMSTVSTKLSNKWGIVMHLRLFSKKKLLALAGYESGHVAVWALGTTHQLLHSLHVHDNPIMCLDIDMISSQVISGSSDHILQTLRLDENLQLHKHMSHDSKTSGFACASVRGDGRIVVCGGWNGKVRVFGWKKMKPLAILKFHSQTVNSISFTRDNMFAVACKDGRITIWDVYKDCGKYLC